MKILSIKRFGEGIKILLLLLALFFLALTGQIYAALTVDVNHSHIKIDFFYHGSTVSIKGTSDPGVDIIIKIASPDGHEVLKRKGKIAGLLWMNVGFLNIEYAPKVYFLYSTKKIEDILSSEEMEKYVIGYSALAKHIKISPVSSEEEKTKWFNEFVRFKEKSGLYFTSTGKISVTEKDGKCYFYLLAEWPYQVPPGVYTVTVYAVKDKRVIETAESNITVEQVGIVKTLANMAKNNGALYGIISIVVAIVAGFGVGMIFRKGGAH